MQPGETGTLLIRTSMHDGMGGPHEFDITIASNDRVAPETVIVVKAQFGT